MTSDLFDFKVNFRTAKNMCDAEGGMIPVSLDTPESEKELREYIAANSKGL
jgi:hypothetical protein